MWGFRVHRDKVRICFQEYNMSLGRDSSVGIGTRYALDGPGIEYKWRRNFPHPSRLTSEITQPTRPRTLVRGLFAGVKRPGRGVDHLFHLTLRLKKD